MILSVQLDPEVANSWRIKRAACHTPMLYILQHLTAVCSVKVSYNCILISYTQIIYICVDVFVPQKQYPSGSTGIGMRDAGDECHFRSTDADDATVGVFPGDGVTITPPTGPCTVIQHLVPPPSQTASRDDTSTNNTWPAADFSRFGEAPASLFQAANFSQFGGPYTEVAQPADFSGFGNASTVIFPSSGWPVEPTWA
jgi:hypothetical protein